MKNDPFTIISPKDGSLFDTLKKPVRKYVDDLTESLKKYDQRFLVGFDQGVDPYDYTLKRKSDSKPRPVIFNFEYEGKEENPTYNLHIQNERFEEIRAIESNKNKIKVYNLVPGRKYHWYLSIKGRREESSLHAFSLKQGPHLIYSPKMFNVRDCGNKVTLDGRYYKAGLFYRGIELTTRKYLCKQRREDSGTLHTQMLHKCDFPYMESLGIKRELDLRMDHESMYMKKSPLKHRGKNIKYSRDPIEAYNVFFNKGDVIEAKKDIFDVISKADNDPVYMHCWGGADRTGTIAFMIGAVLGLSLTDLVMDYELTSFPGNLCRTRKWDESLDYWWRKDANFHFMVECLIKFAKPGETTQETVTRWWIEEVGITQEEIETLKKTFLE